jgi:hypothetical protein
MAAGFNVVGTLIIGESLVGFKETPQDNDAYEVYLQAGQTYLIELRGNDVAGLTATAEYLSANVYDNAGNSLLAGNGYQAGGVRYQSFTPTIDGIYYIDVASYYQHTQGSYALSVRPQADDNAEGPGVGNQPTIDPLTAQGDDAVNIGNYRWATLESAGDKDSFSFKLAQGKEYAFEVIKALGSTQALNDAKLEIFDVNGTLVASGSIVDSLTVQALLPAASTHDGLYYATVSSASGSGTGKFAIAARENTPGSTPFHTRTIELGKAFVASKQTPTDDDLYKIELKAGQSYLIELRGNDVAGLTATAEYLSANVYDNAGNLLLGGTGGYAGGVRYQPFTPTIDGIYYIDVSSYWQNTQGSYALSVRPQADDNAEGPGVGNQPTIDPLTAQGDDAVNIGNYRWATLESA